MFSTPNSNMACGLISTEYFNSTFQDSVVLQQQDPLVGLGGGGAANALAQTHVSSYVYLYTNSRRELQAKTTLSHCSTLQSGTPGK